MRTDIMSRARGRARGARVRAANTSNGDGHLAAARSRKASKVTTARSGVDTLATQPALVTLIDEGTGSLVVPQQLALISCCQNFVVCRRSRRWWPPSSRRKVSREVTAGSGADFLPPHTVVTADIRTGTGSLAVLTHFRGVATVF